MEGMGKGMVGWGGVGVENQGIKQCFGNKRSMYRTHNIYLHVKHILQAGD
jgi:hypothetical protein